MDGFGSGRGIAVMLLIVVAVVLSASFVNSQIALASREDLVQLISNTDDCLVDCETIYRVCNPELTPFSPKDLADFNLSFVNRAGNNLIDSGYQVWTEYNYEVREPIYNTYKDVNDTEITEVIGYNTIPKTRWDWEDLDPYSKTWAADTCHMIRVWGKRQPQFGTGEVDNILSFAGREFKEYTWWNTSAQKCKNITFTNSKTFAVHYNTSPPVRVSLTGLTFTNVTRGIHIVNQGCTRNSPGVAEIKFNLISSTVNSADVELRSPNITADSSVIFSVYYDFDNEYDPLNEPSGIDFNNWTKRLNIETTHYNITFTNDIYSEPPIASIARQTRFKRDGTGTGNEHFAADQFLRHFTDIGNNVYYFWNVNATFVKETPFLTEINWTTIPRAPANMTYTFYPNAFFFKVEVFDLNASVWSYVYQQFNTSNVPYFYQPNYVSKWTVFNSDETQVTTGDLRGAMAYQVSNASESTPVIMYLWNETEWGEDGMGMLVGHKQGTKAWWGTLGNETDGQNPWNNLTYWFMYTTNKTIEYVNDSYITFISNPLSYILGAQQQGASVPTPGNLSICIYDTIFRDRVTSYDLKLENTTNSTTHTGDSGGCMNMSASGLPTGNISIIVNLTYYFDFYEREYNLTIENTSVFNYGMNASVLNLSVFSAHDGLMLSDYNIRLVNDSVDSYWNDTNLKRNSYHRYTKIPTGTSVNLTVMKTNYLNFSYRLDLSEEENITNLDTYVANLTEGTLNWTRPVENTTVFGNEIIMNITTPQNATSDFDIYYSLNNITFTALCTGCTSFYGTITVPSSGVWNITINTTGSIHYPTWSEQKLNITTVHGYYNVTLYNELTGELFNTTQSDFRVGYVNSTVIEVFCPTQRSSAAIPNGSSTYDILVDCTPDMVRIGVIQENYYYYRSLIPTTTNGSLDFYLINISAYNYLALPSVVQTEIFIDDVSGLYTDAKIRIKKAITTTEEIVHEGVLDVTGKIVAYFIIGERYTVELDNGVDTTSDYWIPNSGDTQLIYRVSDLPFVSGDEFTYRNLTWGYFTNNMTGAISFMFNDTTGETISVTFMISYINRTVIYSAKKVNGSNIFFTYTGLNTNWTYIANFSAHHNVFGYINESRIISFAQVKHLIEGIGQIWYTLSVMFLVVFMMLSFTRRNATAGTLMTTLMVAMFWAFGWINAVISSVTIFFMLSIAFFALLLERRRR